MAGNLLNDWQQPVGNSLDNKFVFGGTVETAGGTNLKEIVISTHLDDISTASTAYVVAPFAGTITKIYTIIDGTTATADAVLTAKIGAAAITNGVVTIANGSGAGDVDSATPTAANTVAVGDNINIATDGGSTNTVKAQIYFVITRT